DAQACAACSHSAARHAIKPEASTATKLGKKRVHEEACGLIVFSEYRLNTIIKEWNKYPINLLRSPPSSGKTTLARKLQQYLSENAFKVFSISFVSWTRSKYPDLLYNSDSFDQFWISQIG
ncbi:2351_t:CDS:2, partial [Paraglomus brasilianum]